MADKVLRSALVAVLAAGGCAAPPPSNLESCTDPRPEACTREYRPVCGYAPGSGDRGSITFGNACEACANPKIAGWLPGACAE